MYHMEELARIRRDDAIREGLESQRIHRMLREARRESREQPAYVSKPPRRLRPLSEWLSSLIYQILAWR
jgi:hypothetical protein